MEKITFKNFPYKTTPLNDRNLNQLQTNVENALDDKVDKIEGKGLSTNDYTTTEKNKLAGIEAGANKTTIADNLTTDDSTKVLSAKQGKKLQDDKQSNLVSGINIKTINGDSILGSGNISLLDFFYPIGTLYETTSTDLNTTAKMNAYFGGTWEVYGTGRVIVGYDSSQTEFNTIGKISGETTHTLTINEMPKFRPEAVTNNAVGSDWNTLAMGTAGGTSKNNPFSEIGGGLEHNNLQPSIVAYRYRRIS